MYTITSRAGVSPNFSEADDHQALTSCNNWQLSDDLASKIETGICHEINLDDLDHFPLLF